MPKIIDFDDLSSPDSILSWKTKQDDWTIKDEQWNLYNEKWQLLDEDWEVDIKWEVLKEMEDELAKQLEEAERRRLENLEKIQREKLEEEKRMKEQIEQMRKDWIYDDFDDYSDPFSEDEDNEEERVKKIFINEITKHKSNFKEWFNWINFNYKSINSLLIESISVQELSSEEILFDDSEKFKICFQRKLYRIPSWESEYDHLSAMKWNKFEFYREDDIIDKDCNHCYWTWQMTCKVCKWEKDLLCRTCMWECTVQERKVEKKLVDKWICPICWWSKNKICWTCRWNWFLLWPCWNCWWKWRAQDWSWCRVCNWQWQVKAACWSCSWNWKVHCWDCSNEWRFLIHENVESFQTVKCKECDWKGKKTCRECHWEWEYTCQFCDWEWNLKWIKMFKKEFEIDKKRELFYLEDTVITKEEISAIRDMKWTQVRLPLEDFYINTYLKDWRKEIFNRFVQEYQSSESKKKTIYWKQISFELWSYSYLWKIYRVFIQWWKVYKIELPETSSWKIIKNIVSAWFVAKWVLWNLFWKKTDLQKDLEELNNWWTWDK